LSEIKGAGLLGPVPRTIVHVYSSSQSSAALLEKAAEAPVIIYIA